MDDQQVQIRGYCLFANTAESLLCINMLKEPNFEIAGNLDATKIYALLKKKLRMGVGRLSSSARKFKICSFTKAPTQKNNGKNIFSADVGD